MSVRNIQDLKTNKDKLEQLISDIESKDRENFYLTESVMYIEKYKKILNTPMKMNFMGKPISNNKEKQELVKEYISIANKYVTIKHVTPAIKHKLICQNCEGKDLDTLDNVHICVSCGAELVVLSHTSCYNDVDRANISSKYTYDRKVHFRDCINQHQGTQNCTIEEKVYKELEEEFEKHHLLEGDKTTQKKIRFRRIEKHHIHIFLKELGYTKHYENLNLIHYKFTGKKPDDISYLEDKLLDDFDRLTELYDKRYKQEKKIDRKNFINTQYVLYQLLQRHKHKCDPDDFHILKTIDRQSFHDEITSALFLELNHSGSNRWLLLKLVRIL